MKNTKLQSQSRGERRGLFGSTLISLETRGRTEHSWRRMGGRNSSSGGFISRELVVVNRLGIHARPAAMFVRIANRFHSEILVEKDGERINGKSIMGLMMLAAGPGSRLQLQAAGEDADDALRALEELVTVRKFDEE